MGDNSLLNANLLKIKVFIVVHVYTIFEFKKKIRWHGIVFILSTWWITYREKDKCILAIAIHNRKPSISVKFISLCACR